MFKFMFEAHEGKNIYAKFCETELLTKHLL